MTPAIYRIVVCDEQYSAEEQEEQVLNAATQMIDDFVEVNTLLYHHS